MSFLNPHTSSPHKLSRPNGAGPISAPSPTPSNTSTTSTKRKRNDNTTVYSQPEITGSGTETLTQVTYAVAFLKEKDSTFTITEILRHLSRTDPNGLIRNILEGHSQVEYNPNGFGGQGSFRFRPKHNVRSADDLRAYLQSQTTTQGISVRELKEGWPNALQEINQLERKGEILVTRLKKDNVPKMVWQNDPTLSTNIDEEFKEMWHRAHLPANPDDLRAKLEQAGLKPTSAPREVGGTGKAKEKKKRAPRKGGRTTNAHMASLLKDYSHKRK